MPEFMPLPEAIARYIHDGDAVAFEGFTHLIPHAAAHETIRQGRRDLTLIRMTPDIVYDQMIGMGLAAQLVFSYAGNPGVGLLRRLRDAVEHGWPNRPGVDEYSHAAMANAYEAGAAGLPCAVFRGYLGTELAEVNPNVRELRCPFSGERLAAIPALRPDVAVIHAQRAYRQGNVLIEGITGVNKEVVLAARRAVVTVEDIVPALDTHPNACVLPRWPVDAICRVPGGAHPSYAHGVYDRDNAFYLEWDRISADRDAFADWMDAHVLRADPDVFGHRVRHLRSRA